MPQKYLHRALSLAISIALGTLPAYAAEDNPDGEEEIEKMAVVGSRAAPRSVEDSPVPIDIIDGEDLFNQGNTDMLSVLSTSIPSFNVNAQPISDAATLIRPANLRGLPPDSTLVLVNGKRRHRSAVIAFLGGGISDGSQGPDLSVIPGIALKQVEVLRDGAAAQYGSDAIAGVLNFVLKDNAEGGIFEVRYGEFYEGDGDTTQYSGNIGLPLTENGFANFSFEYKESDATSRSVQRDDAAGLIAAGNTFVADPAQIWGSPNVDNDIKIFANIGLDLGDNKEFYLFGNWAERDVDGGFFFRNPNTRDGVNTVDGGQTLLIGDLDLNDGFDCRAAENQINIVGNVPDAAALAAINNNPNCFVFNQMFPGGFTPRFGGTVVDTSIAIGTRGEFANELRYDVSINVGRSDVEFFINNTVNASLGPNTPTKFRPGNYSQLEKNFNLDLSYPLDVDFLATPINVAVGFEFREETFEITAGDPASFEIGPLASQGFLIGSNGFAGFKPEDAGTFDRRNFGLYLDLEANLTEDFLVGAAIRFEDYDDFGDTTNGKITARYQFTDALALRGSFSTGFRAPTVGQSNVRNVTTAFGPLGLEDQATLPPTNPISVQKGGVPLEPEDSTSFTIGAIMRLGDLHLTIDYFNIEVEDRISQTAPLSLSQSDIDNLVGQGIQDALSFKSVRFFTNDFDTTTQGIDVVANYTYQSSMGVTKFSLAYNWTDTQVDKFNPEIIGETRVKQLEENLPEYRLNFTTNHIMGPWRGLVRVNFFGEFFEAHLDAGDLPIDVGSEVTVDAEVGYDFTENYSLVVGAQNIFDTFPDKNPHSGIVGATFPVTSPFGFNGGFYYVRAQYHW